MIILSFTELLKVKINQNKPKDFMVQGGGKQVSKDLKKRSNW
jgi:hypothetical protein